ELARATAVILAFSIDPARATRREGPTEEGGSIDTTDASSRADGNAPTEASDMVTDTTRDAGLVTESAPESSASFALGVGVAADRGGLTGVAFAPRVWAAWLPRDLRLELALTYFPQAERLIDPTRGVRLSLGAVAISACRPWASAVVAGGPCAAVETGF